jgi:hypothetical protein
LQAVVIVGAAGEVTPEGTDGSVSGGPLDDGVEPTDITDTDHEWGD